MSIRPWRDIERRKSRQIFVGNVPVGGDAPISVQSMTNTLTHDVAATVAQIHQLEEAGADFICNAGFMRILTDGFVEKWWNRQINIHPSLLPAFKGLNVHARAIEAGVRISGATVHYVRPEMDEGPIIAQAAVPVMMDDTEETLAQRVLEAEHKLYPLALRLVAEGRVRIVNERAVISPAPEGLPPTLIVPGL
jgi:phosphoribosylglycinamide formyltransferase-1